MKKILISDSLKQFVSGENILSRANIQLLTASSSQEILSMHRDVRADLIIIDVDMPGMPGDELCSLLRKEPEPNPVKVLIAVEPKETDIKRAEQCNANTYITKPINSALFFSKIASLLDIQTRKAYRMSVKVTVAGEMGNVKLTASTINMP